MSVDFESRILHEPANVPGQIATGRLDHFFTPHDEAPLGYWRKPNGHIILAQYGENGTEKKLDRGFERLGQQYGSYASAGSRTWNPANDPLYPLVVKGGLRELPGEQIKLLGWHRPPDRTAKASHRAVEEMVQRVVAERRCERGEAVLAVMPQLVGLDLDDYVCAACPGRWFPTEAAMLAHESVMHKDAVQSRSIGSAVAQAQARQGPPVSDASTDALLTLIANQGEMIAAMRAEIDALRAERSVAAVAKPAAKPAPKKPDSE